MLNHIPHYCLPYQQMKPYICIYSHPFPDHICWWWSIKILPNRPIFKNNSVCWTLSISLTHHLQCPFQKLHNLLHIIMFILSLGKFSSCLISWNIEKREGIIWCGSPTSQICINSWRLMGVHFHSFGNKCIILVHK